MDAHGQAWCRPQNTDPDVVEEPLLDFSSGYVLRALDQFPRQGSKTPWKMRMSYAHDVVALRRGEVDDGGLVFGGTPARASAPSYRAAV